MVDAMYRSLIILYFAWISVAIRLCKNLEECALFKFFNVHLEKFNLFLKRLLKNNFLIFLTFLQVCIVLNMRVWGFMIKGDLGPEMAGFGKAELLIF